MRGREAAVAATQGPHAVRGADPGSTGPGSTGPGSTGPASTGPGNTGPGSAGPGNTGPGSAGARSRELGQLDWLPLTDDELRGILGRGDPGGLGREPVVTWRSPRPMSAAALVRHGDTAVFVKRHHLGVR